MLEKQVTIQLDGQKDFTETWEEKHNSGTH